MSKFLTPPVWYDKNGNLNEMLTGNAEAPSDIAIGSRTTATGGGIAIGGSSSATVGGIAIGGSASNGGIAIRGSVGRGGGIAIGGNASDGGMAIGVGASANEENGIAIGRYATAGASGCIAIGYDADASTPNTIQLGDNATAYTLNVGDGTSSTVQAGGYKIGTTTIIDSNRNISGNSFLSTGYIQCPVLQISSKFVGSKVFDTKTNQGLIEITIGDSTSAIYLATIIAEYKEQDGTSRYHRQHFGIIPSMAYSRNSSGGIAYPPDTVIEVPMITRVNDAPYNNTWKMAHLEFSPQSSKYPLYCDFSQVMRSDSATGPYSSDIIEIDVYVNKIIDFPSPIL